MNLSDRNRTKRMRGTAARLAGTVLLFLAVLCVCMCARVTAQAAPQLLVDEADNLTPDEERALTDMLIEVSDRYDADIVVLVIDSLNGSDAQAYADDFYDQNGYADDGALFLFSVGDSEYAFSTLGRTAEALTDAALDMIEDDVLNGLRNGKATQDYYDAYVAYIEGVDTYLGIAESGTPFEYETEEPIRGFEALRQTLGGNVLFSAIGGFVGSFLYMGRQKSKLKSVHRQRGAATYVTGGGPALTVSDDRFVNKSVNRTPIRQSAPPSSSRTGSARRGTTYHTSSSGRSHGGRSGKF